MIERRWVRARTLIRFRDEPLSDGAIYRRYDDGRVEWRWRLGTHHVGWRDGAGQEGSDERLGRGIIKRRGPDGVRWGREQGFGRTAWAGGDIVTINVTSLTGGASAALGVAFASPLLTLVLAPPVELEPAEEEELRRALREEPRRVDPNFGTGDLGDDDLGGHDDAFG